MRSSQVGPPSRNEGLEFRSFMAPQYAKSKGRMEGKAESALILDVAWRLSAQGSIHRVASGVSNVETQGRTNKDKSRTSSKVEVGSYGRGLASFILRLPESFVIFTLFMSSGRVLVESTYCPMSISPRFCCRQLNDLVFPWYVRINMFERSIPIRRLLLSSTAPQSNDV